jgi:hypothetical protein
MTDIQAKDPQAKWVEKALLGIILMSVVFCAALLVLPLWSAMTELPLRQAAAQQCIAINDDNARLGCYDREASRRLAPPAKGPYPPERLFGQ